VLKTSRISTVLRKAKEKGIKVITWDAECRKGRARLLYQSGDAQGIGYTLTDEAARILNIRETLPSSLPRLVPRIKTMDQIHQRGGSR